MFEFFKKKRIYSKVQIAILALFLFDIGTYLIPGKETQGKVVRYASFSSGGSGYPNIRYPVVKFEAGGKNYKFNGNWDADYSYGDVVNVVYKPWRPKKAKIKTFWGICKRPLIQIIICSLVWLMIYSSFKPSANKPNRPRYKHPGNPFI